MSNKYRLYIDEVGNHDMQNVEAKNERFLTLFGVIVESQYMLHSLQPDMAAIKRNFFQSDPDEPVVFHRKDMVRKRGPFACLWDNLLRNKFDEVMLAQYREWEYTAMAVTIDKKEHLNQYGHWANEPYFYCLKALLERYVLFLHYSNNVGDVMLESRNPDLDLELSKEFTQFFQYGTKYIPASKCQNILTSRELKIKKKSANICGLQLADLLAHAGHYSVLCEFGIEENQKARFGSKVAQILLELKYHRSVSGQLRGYGMKLLP